MLPVHVIQPGRSIVDKESKTKDWIKNIFVKREELGGFSICPYAFSAYVEIIECDVASVALKPGDAEVIVYIVENSVISAAIQQKVTELNMKHYDYVSEAMNFNNYNVIITKKRDKLVKAEG